MTAVRPAEATLSENLRGAALMVGAMAAYTLNDTCMKALSAEMPLFQAMLIRGIATTAILVVAGLMLGRLTWRMSPRDRWLNWLRALTEVAATYFFLTALFNMPLANVTAILQVLPLTVALAGALFLREPVGWRRLVAIGIGFLGVMLIVRPGTEGFSVYALYALAAVIIITARELLTRRLSPEAPSITVAVTTSFGVALFAAVGIGVDGAGWVPVSPRSAALLAGATAFLIFGYLLSVMVMRVGDIGFVSPFRYTGLIVAIVLGIAVFGEWPDALTLSGAALIVATGVFTLLREQRLARRTGG